MSAFAGGAESTGFAVDALHLLLAATLKGSLLILGAAVVAAALRRSSAAVRHLVWAIGLAGLLLVAPLSLTLPAWPVSLPSQLKPLVEVARRAEVRSQPGAQANEGVTVPLYAARATEGATASSTAGEEVEPDVAGRAEAPSRLPRPAGLLLLLWALGAGALATSLSVAGLRLLRTLRRAAAVDDPQALEAADAAARSLGLGPRRFRLKWTDEPLTPMTLGFLRPTILLPRLSLTWTGERLSQVLVHEMAHVARRDALTQAVGALACVVYWFNPLVWWAARRVVVERERACDDCVLQSGARASSYASDLLEIARTLGAGWTAARISPAMARRSQISGRLLAVLDPGLRRSAPGRGLVLTAALLGTVVLLPFAALALTPAPGEVTPAATARVVESLPPAAVPRPVTVAPRSGADLETALPGIAAAQSDLEEALGRRDAAAVSEVYAEDAISMVPGMLPLRGRRSIQDATEQMMAQGVAVIDSHRTEAHVVGDMVCELGRATFRTASGRPVAAMRYMTLWRREGKHWRIYRDYVTPEEVKR